MTWAWGRGCALPAESESRVGSKGDSRGVPDVHRGPQCSRVRGPARSRPCPSAGRPRPRAQRDRCRRRSPHPGDRPAARSACSPLVAEPTGGTSHFPPMAGEAVSFVSGAQAPRAEAAPPACAPTPHLHTVPVPPGSGASGLLPPPSGCVKCLRPGTRMSPGPSREEARCETAGPAARPPLCPTGPQGRDAQPQSVCRRRSPHGPRSPSRSAVASCRDVLIFCAF